MGECLVQKSAVAKDDMKIINQFSRRELTEDEVYIFTVTLCNNDIDRDNERFSVNALNQLAKLFVGKTGISDHSMRSADQKARIFDTWVEKKDGKTIDGEPLYCLMARAYMLNNDTNRALIDEIDAGIKKEVSVSCSMSKGICSICGKDKRHERCEHIAGREYNGKKCFVTLDDASDAYEFSFVAVPAQRDAGVTKSFDTKEVKMDNIIKSICESEEDMILSKSQVKELSTYIESLKEEASLAEDYKKQLSKEVVALFAKSFPNMDNSLFASITSVMTTKELLGFRDGMKKTDKSSKPAPQLAPKDDKSSKDYSQFRI